MSDEIFKEIVDAIKERTPDMLTFYNVHHKEFADIHKGLRHRTNYLEQIHWFAADRILKVVIPSPLHECAGGWINQMIVVAAMRGILPKVWPKTMLLTSSPGSKKEADLTFVPMVGPDWTQKAEYPSVVLESGWDESMQQLHRDAQLWQRGSGGEVCVVIQVKFYRPNDENRMRAKLVLKRTLPGERHVFVEPYASLFATPNTTDPTTHDIFPAPNNPQENPSISFYEFYAGDCPPGVNPEAGITLDLASLRDIAGREMRARGSQHA
ncbi:hypothetical protein L873DRAFT_1795752 [Choiromyces venosus 120613-1]|uniref:Uncharacterized protein n=1 Tax=Choiromyces venosus 120613-1 TaxID=1336337 RepID=A0A3N4IVX4_9PEZI|nr:hypothetical protein L873DRAFT_1795752 [Choiromyces venosus 120613-1]